MYRASRGLPTCDADRGAKLQMLHQPQGRRPRHRESIKAMSEPDETTRVYDECTPARSSTSDAALDPTTHLAAAMDDEPATEMRRPQRMRLDEQQSYSPVPFLGKCVCECQGGHSIDHCGHQHARPSLPHVLCSAPCQQEAQTSATIRPHRVCGLPSRAQLIRTTVEQRYEQRAIVDSQRRTYRS